MHQRFARKNIVQENFLRAIPNTCLSAEGERTVDSISRLKPLRCAMEDGL